MKGKVVKNVKSVKLIAINGVKSLYGVKSVIWKIITKYMKHVNVVSNIRKKEVNISFWAVKNMKKRQQYHQDTIYQSFLIYLIFVRKILKSLHCF